MNPTIIKPFCFLVIVNTRLSRGGRGLRHMFIDGGPPGGMEYPPRERTRKILKIFVQNGEFKNYFKT